MPRGAKPGERRGGRAAGTPNKKTLLEREGTAEVAAIIAGADLTAAAAVGKAHKLRRGKDILNEFANLYAGLAARYQPWPAEAGKNPNEDEERFKLYSALAVHAADKAADFFDPRFRAIAVAAQQPGDQGAQKPQLALPPPGDVKGRERWASLSYQKLVSGADG